ncbi:alpha-tectorin-like [Mixophyes fleayi]|uniref:alpha-tectorin-like n=1 Tax=Mixophyes fleayi TaxID=3061075 RepID=UPI003F4D93BF
MEVVSRVTPLLLLVLISIFEQGSAETEGLFYPYGLANGDEMNPVEDDGASRELPLSITFKFFGKDYKSLFVNNNGLISFDNAVSHYTPAAFPLTNGEIFVTPFWADVDNNRGGSIYYRETNDPDVLQKITGDMDKHLPDEHYIAKWAFIATWDKVGYFGSTSKKVNTFQTVLTSNGYQYFVILNYGDIQWTTGKASGGDPHTGLGGTPAQAGFNSGDDTHYFNIPGSRTMEVLKIRSTSNVYYPGRWVFKVDHFEVPGGCVFQAKFAKEGEEFWKEPTCNTKCLCNKKVTCVDEGCPDNTTCEPSGSFFTCKPTEKICF